MGHSSNRGGGSRALVVPVIGALTIASAGCSTGGRADRPPVYPKAPVVLVSIDTLRSDRLPAYGYRGVETPAIDALRRDGILFERAYSQVPLTLPSHVSLLTGLLPGEHGVRDNLGYRFDAAAHPCLPDLLRRAGYRTGGFASAYVLRSETGLATGFETYDAAIEIRAEDPLGRSQRSGAETLERALAWLDGVHGEPYFLFFHIYEPHTPYEPPEPFASRYADRYVGEVAASDRLVGQLIDALRARGDYERAVVVLVSDHGEGLGDHGELEHGIFLYRESIQVPLIVKLPTSERAGSTVPRPVPLIDVFPTVLSLVGVEIPPLDHARPLLGGSPPGEGDRPIFSETMYPRLHYGWSELTSLVRDRYQLIDGPDPELYDLVADRAQKRNLRDSDRDTFAGLREAIESYRTPLAGPAEEDAETRERLASLGYVGSAVATGDGPLADPKSQLTTLKTHGEAFAHYFRKEYPEAAALFRDLLRENPRMLDAWEHLGIALERMGRTDDARAALTRAMEISGGSPQIALVLSRVLLAQGELAAAEAHARLGLTASKTVAHSVLSQVALARNDLATAEREAKEALDAGGSRVGALMNLAQVLARQQRLAEAMRAIDEARSTLARLPGKESFQGLDLVRGDILGRLGRNREAIEAFRAEVAAFPWSVSARSRLVLLYALEGQEQLARETLTAMCRENDSAGCWAETVRTLRALGQATAADRVLSHAASRFPSSRELTALSRKGQRAEGPEASSPGTTPPSRTVRSTARSPRTD